MTNAFFGGKSHSCKFLLGFAAMALMVSGVQAKTVAWYRFEDCNGPITRETIFTNSVDAAKYPMYAGVCNFGGNNKYDKAKLTDTAEYMPFLTNGFSTVEMRDPETGRFHSNAGAVSVNSTRCDNHSDPHAELFIDDEESLHLQTFTLEFFMRQPDVTTGFRCLVCRPGGVYNGANEAFRLEMSILGGGASYFPSLKFATVEDEPLYDKKGNVTNSTVNTISPSSGTSHFDDGKWHHFAIVVDGAGKTVTFYSDYAKHGSTTYTGNLLYQPGYPFCFGGHPQCTYYNCPADFSEIRISDEALTPAQMLRYSRPKSQYASVVDDRTLIYLPFEGSTDSVTVGAEMKTPVTYTPFLANCAVAGPFSGIDATIGNRSATTPNDPQTVADITGTSMRFGLCETGTTANAQCAHVTTNGVEDCNYARPIVVHTSSNVQQDLFGDSCTFEAFFKMPKTGITYPGTQIHLFALWSCFSIMTKENGDWDQRRIWAQFNGNNLDGNAISGFNDDKWHHVAFVYDKTLQRGDLYLDYKWRTSRTDPAFNPQPHKSYINDLILGGSYWGSDRWFVNFKFDEVRVTRGTLRPYEFLTSRAVETADLAYAGFDGDFHISPYADFFTAAVASAFTSGGSAPVIERTRPGKIIHEGQDGPVVKEKNLGSIRFAGGQLVYPDHGIVADRADQTVQFFVKSSSAAAGAGLVRVNRDSKNDLGAPSWAVSFADAAGNLSVAVDTDALTGQSHTFAAPVADGAWHHVAITFEKVGTDTQVTLYRDYAAVGTHTFAGGLMTRFRDVNLMLGAGDVATAGFTGWLDELRITPGVLSPVQFLRAESFGLMMVVR